MPSIVTRPVITSMAPAIRLNWRTVVAVTWGWRQWKSVTISTIGEFRCGLRVVVLHNATLHDNGPPHLIFGEGIDLRILFYSLLGCEDIFLILLRHCLILIWIIHLICPADQQ